jgi:arginyl-tRNA synthetase
MSAIIKHYRAEIIRAVEAANNLKVKKSLVPAKKYFILELERQVQKVAPKVSIVIPPPHVAADLALIGVSKDQEAILLKVIKKNVQVEKAEASSPFINVWLKKDAIYRDVISILTRLSDQYGANDTGKKQTAIIEYSSPNITKPIGVGHLRSTIIGASLANIYEALGYKVIRENYLGDWGTQFGKVIYGYKKWADKAAVEARPIQALKDVYVKFNKEAEANPALEDEARMIFQKLESGDNELIRLWKHFRDLSIGNYKQIYDRLGVTFDVYTGEGFFADRTDEIIKRCLKEKLCRKDKASQAVIVDELAGVPSFLLRKSDGATLYLTRELALMKFRVTSYKPQVILIAVGSEQTLHFRQLQTLATKLGFLKKVRFEHIGFGMVLTEGKKMATRQGSVVELEELINESVARSEEIIKEKNPDLSEAERQTVAEIVGVGAVIYNDLRQSREKNINFDWARMLNFETGSAAYLQYTYARIQSILRKAISYKLKTKSFIFEDESEWQLVKKLMFFPQTIQKAQGLNAPHVIATYLEELAQLFNSFYASVPVLKTENEKLKASRLALIASVAQTIKNGLGILNIKVPERM